MQVTVYDTPLTIESTHYGNGRLAVLLVTDDGSEWGRVSVNVVEARLSEGEFVLSHNCRGIEKQLLASGAFEDTGRTVSYGFVSDQPIWRLA